MKTPDHWLLWQLADSAFPAGSFGHSGGLEAAWQLGEVTSVEDYACSSLQQLSRASLPFVLDGHSAPDRFAEFDRLCDLFLSNHIANRGSRLMGKSFIIAAEQSFRSSALHEFRRNARVGHFAPAFGAILRLLEVDRPSVACLFTFLHLRGILASAVRLGIVGPLEAQRLQFKLSPFAESVVENSLHITTADMAHTAPLLDIWQGAHDRLYSRLFQT